MMPNDALQKKKTKKLSWGPDLPLNLKNLHILKGLDTVMKSGGPPPRPPWPLTWTWLSSLRYSSVMGFHMGSTLLEGLTAASDLLRMSWMKTASLSALVGSVTSQVYSLTQSYSVELSQSRIGVKRVFSAQSKFAALVIGGVLGPLRLAQHL